MTFSALMSRGQWQTPADLLLVLRGAVFARRPHAKRAPIRLLGRPFEQVGAAISRL
jgi:hypothetical protein